MSNLDIYISNIKKHKVSLIIRLVAIVFLVTLLGIMAQPKDNKVHLKFSTWGSKSEIDIIKPLINDFEKENPNIKVEFMHIPQSYFQKIHLLFASKTPPDVLFINNQNVPYYADAGVLLPLDRDLYKNDFEKKALDSLSYQGKLYAVPRDISTIVVYYNDSLFSMYNVRKPSHEWTLDDMLAKAICLSKDVDNDGKTDFWGVSFEENPPLYYLPYLMSKGGGILSEDGQNMIIDSDESQSGLEFYSNLRNLYHVAPTAAESASETMLQMFLQGRLAMFVSGRWVVPKLKSDAKFYWNVMNFPKGENGSVVPLDASGWAIAKSSHHKKEAQMLIDFLASKNSISKITQSELIVPARFDVQQAEFLNIDKNINDRGDNLRNSVFLDSIKTSKITPVSVDYNVVLDEVKTRTNYIFNVLK